MERMAVEVPVWWMTGEWMEVRKEKEGVGLVVECSDGVAGGQEEDGWDGGWMDGQMGG